MTECGTCKHKGETVSGEHCGRCVRQDDSPTQYEEVTISDRERMLTWAFQRLAEQQKQIDALNAYHGDCESCRWMNEDEEGPHCVGCVHNAKECYQPMSNHDRLRTMEADKFAEWLDGHGICIGERCPEFYSNNDCGVVCVKQLEEWLSKPVENQRSESNAAF